MIVGRVRKVGDLGTERFEVELTVHPPLVAAFR
jgi:hypothetical protein